MHGEGVYGELMKRFVGAVIVIILAVILAGVFFITPNISGAFAQQSLGEITIGVLAPLTGDLANYGEGEKNALLLAADEINSIGGINGKKIKLVFEDSPCNPTEALTAATKLIEINDAKLLVGPMCSGELLAIAPTLNQNKITAIGIGATSPSITNAGDYVFRDSPSDDLRAKVFAEYIYKDRNVGIMQTIYENDDAGAAFNKYFVEYYTGLGGKMTEEEAYEKGSTDFRSVLTKINSIPHENIAVFSFPSETGEILKQSKELGINTNFFEGFEVMSDPQIMQIAGNATEGVVYIQSAQANNEAATNFKKNYIAKFKKEAPYYAAESYDALKIYAETLKRTNGDTGKIKDELYKIKNYEGASGTTTFDEHGDVLKPFEIGQVVNGELVTIKVVE